MTRRGAILVALLLLVGCAEENAEEAPLRPVRTLSIEVSGAGAERELPGRLQAVANRRLSFRVAGQIASYGVAVGEAVAAGQLLARLEATDLRLQRDRARSSLAGAEAAAANAEAEWQRARRLYEAGSAPARDLDAARAQVEAARARRDSARDALALAERQLSFTRLEAPGDCGVATRLAEVSENVAAGQPVLVLACGEDLEVRAALPEDLLDELSAGAPVRVHLPLAGLSVAGEVTEIGLPVDPRQATWPLRVRLVNLADDERERLRPGMAAELTLPLNGPGSGIWVPMVAVQRDARGPYVYIADPVETAQDADAEGREATIRRREVVLGAQQGERMRIDAGLAAGLSLVIAGMSRLHDGQRVRVMDAHREAQP
ncbi:efflux RND transporter periplasmic adaptor subunit [Halomonas lysinitropha]|uniref:Efflux pump periplasmic linker BepF n=1 Tax=Halomonas lysinitropha TaxID=2607506 RepID=A0A5K1IAU6_9GAMM|nr:efflux RND transporter periplasmic adaptor subunit [Halomonas lysinitropha]VVZ97428.1 Efflux pump periplasmic linker BepF [Halomonas lysinitropha]